MEIIYKSKVPGDPRAKEKLLKMIGEFMDADKVEYKDCDVREEITLRRGRKKLIIIANGNSVDGGWFEVKKR